MPTGLGSRLTFSCSHPRSSRRRVASNFAALGWRLDMAPVSAMTAHQMSTKSGQHHGFTRPGNPYCSAPPPHRHSAASSSWSSLSLLGLSRRLEQLDRIAVGILQLDLPAARHLITKM